jgi:hypothetical protein
VISRPTTTTAAMGNTGISLMTYLTLSYNLVNA